MRAGLEMDVKQEDWKNAAIRASNLSELELTLGEVAGAVGDAEQSVIVRRPQRRCVSADGITARPMPTPCTRRAAEPRRRRASARPSGCRPSGSPITRCCIRSRASCIATCS